jgi:outer membrane protein OmpA-like peptidoglycan-associated protein
VDGRVTQSLANRYKRTQVQEFSVGFKSGDSTLSEEAQQSLQNAAKLLQGNPTYTADSIGHTDDVGNARYNINLSWRRQEAIRRFLMQNGCDLNRIFFIGVGEEKASGKDSPGRAQDRRGTIVVYRPVE